jgi:hypothetical protein
MHIVMLHDTIMQAVISRRDPGNIIIDFWIDKQLIVLAVVDACTDAEFLPVTARDTSCFNLLH